MLFLTFRNISSTLDHLSMNVNTMHFFPHQRIYFFMPKNMIRNWEIKLAQKDSKSWSQTRLFCLNTLMNFLDLPCSRSFWKALLGLVLLQLAIMDFLIRILTYLWSPSPSGKTSGKRWSNMVVPWSTLFPGTLATNQCQNSDKVL